MVAQAIAHLQTVVDRALGFYPGESTRTFTVAATDHHQTSEGPRIAAARYFRRLVASATRD